jgi:hypothetical protein
MKKKVSILAVPALLFAFVGAATIHAQAYGAGSAAEPNTVPSGGIHDDNNLYPGTQLEPNRTPENNTSPRQIDSMPQSNAWPETAAQSDTQDSNVLPPQLEPGNNKVVTTTRH